MKIICLTPQPWAWVPIVIVGGYVAAHAILYFADKKRPGWGMVVGMMGLVVTVFAAYPFFLAWITK